VVDFPFGHVEHNCTVPIGAEALLDADAAQLEIIESAVAS
jgi:muramoyltetrapeptide carboxypeptidase LdcA involved in peptidoglycan recycling